MVSILDYDQEAHEWALRQDGYEEGYDKGYDEGVESERSRREAAEISAHEAEERANKAESRIKEERTAKEIAQAELERYKRKYGELAED